MCGRLTALGLGLLDCNRIRRVVGTSTRRFKALSFVLPSNLLGGYFFFNFVNICIDACNDSNILVFKFFFPP